MRKLFLLSFLFLCASAFAQEPLGILVGGVEKASLLPLSDGRLIAAERTGRAVRELSADGSQLTTFADDLGRLGGIEELNNGRLLVTSSSYFQDRIEHYILSLSPEGSLDTFATGLRNPQAIARLQDGRVLIATSSYNVVSFTEDGTSLGLFAWLPELVGDIEQLEDGRILVGQADSSRIDVFGPDGTPQGTFTNEAPNVFGFCQQADGTILATVYSRGDAALDAFDLAGNRLRRIASELQERTDVACLPDGRAVVFRANGDLIAVSPVDGSVQTLVPSFDPSTITTLEDGSILVAELIQDRVTRYSSQGDHIGIFAENIPILRDMTQLQDGRILLTAHTKSGENETQIYSADGVYQGLFAEELNYPEHLIALQDGGVAITSSETLTSDKILYIYSGYGELISSRDYGLDDLKQGIQLMDGRILIRELWTGRVHALRADGEYIEVFADGVRGAGSITQLTDGRVLVPNYFMDTVHAYSASGEDLGVLLSNIDWPSDIVQHPDGRLLVGTERGAIRAFSIAALPVSSDSPPLVERMNSRAFPNPFRERATITFALAASEDVRLTLHDALGRTVAVLADGLRAPGEHRVEIGADLRAGVYLWRLQAGGRVESGRVTRVG